MSSKPTNGGARRFSADSICSFAACDSSIFRALKSRSRLLPDPSTARQERPRLYSLTDAYELRTVVVLRSHGLAASDAVAIAAASARPHFVAAARGDHDFEVDHLPILAIRRGAGGDAGTLVQHGVLPVTGGDAAGDILARGDAVLLLDLAAVVRFVTHRLAALHPAAAA